VLTNNPLMFNSLEKILDTIEWEQKDYTNWYWRPKQTTELKQALLDTHNLLATEYVDKLFPKYELGYRDLWNGIDIGADNYHSDLNEGPNAFFLLYFNTMTKDTGGGFGFRNAITKEETGFIYPKSYDIIFGSQQSCWEHRAENLNTYPIDRLVANFGFVCEGL